MCLDEKVAVCLLLRQDRCPLLRQDRCLLLRQDGCLVSRQDRCLLLRQGRCVLVGQGAVLLHYFTYVLFQQKSSVLFQQQTSVLSQQKTSVLSQHHTVSVSETGQGPDTCNRDGSRQPYFNCSNPSHTPRQNRGAVRMGIAVWRVTEKPQKKMAMGSICQVTDMARNRGKSSEMSPEWSPGADKNSPRFQSA